MGIARGDQPCAIGRQQCRSAGLLAYTRGTHPSDKLPGGAREFESPVPPCGTEAFEPALIDLRSLLRRDDQATPSSALPIAVLARKLFIALWRFVTTGKTLEGVILPSDGAERPPRKSISLSTLRSRWLQGGLPIDDRKSINAFYPFDLSGTSAITTGLTSTNLNSDANSCRPPPLRQQDGELKAMAGRNCGKVAAR